MITEHQEQSMLITWARTTESHWPELALLHAIPNGGWRHKATAGRLKAEGLKAGVPDLCLPVARHPFHGLYLEMKSKKGRVRQSQRWWLDQLNAQGYRAVVCRGFASAVDVITEYLGAEERDETEETHHYYDKCGNRL